MVINLIVRKQLNEGADSIAAANRRDVDVDALPLLVVEMAVPVGQEDEWNTWYHEMHIPDVLGTVDGAVRSRRYRLISGDEEYRYLVLHEFASVEQLHKHHASSNAERWADYRSRWGAPSSHRRRAFDPIWEAEAGVDTE